MSVRLLIADDHEVVRRGLASVVAGTDIEIVGEASQGEDVTRMALELKPDIVLMDIRMPKAGGLTALQQIRDQCPYLPVLVLSTYDNPSYVARALALGASGYLLKGCGREEILSKIRTAALGENVWSANELRRFSRGAKSQPSDPDLEVTLTQRELEVLRNVTRGLTNKQIAKLLYISAETVKEHIQNILRKVGVSDRTQAAVWAVRRGVA